MPIDDSESHARRPALTRDRASRAFAAFASTITLKPSGKCASCFRTREGRVRRSGGTANQPAADGPPMWLRALPLVFGRPLSYKIQVKGRCEDLEECK
jgi:hypothetical protein